LSILRLSVWCHLVSTHHKPFRFSWKRSSRSRLGPPSFQLFAETAFQFCVIWLQKRCDCFRCLEEVVGAMPIRVGHLLKQCQLGIIQCFCAGSCRTVEVVLACRLHLRWRRSHAAKLRAETK